MSYIYFVNNLVNMYELMIFRFIIFTSKLCLCKCTWRDEITYICSASKILLHWLSLLLLRIA